MSAWFSKKPKILSTDPNEADIDRGSRMEGLWVKCADCGEILYRADLEKLLNVCPSCSHHMPFPTRARLNALLDPGTFEELDTALEPQDPLGFSDSKKYRDRLKSTKKNIGEPDAFVSGVG